MDKLAEHFLDRKIFSEHHAAYDKKYRVTEDIFKDGFPNPINFKGKKEYCCFAIDSNRKIENGYFIGVDWLIENNKAVYVQPKLNRKKRKKDTATFNTEGAKVQVNYLAMLFSALKHPEVFEHTTDLFEIKWDKPEIKINQQQDMLTPLLVLQYLQVVKTIVRKGLKKSYYKVEQNLRSRVTGKVLVAQNIKQNQVKAKTLNTFCAFEEFGFNGIENRLLKNALVFVQRYLATLKGLGSESFFTQTFNYINPAFEQVSAEASLYECQHLKTNPFYKEYKQAIDLAKQILRRFGFNIQNAVANQTSTPPFWVDMSKLFELYVLGLLKDSYGNIQVDFQFGNRANKLDFLLNTKDFTGVVDAKYKLKYNSSNIGPEDVRQVSGYARMHKVYKQLGKEKNEIIDCLIVYPEPDFLQDGNKAELKLALIDPHPDYVQVFKVGVKLPAITIPQLN